MKICILSGDSGLDVKPLIIEQAQKKFDSMLYASLKKIRIVCRDDGPKIYYKNKDLSEYDVVWIRVFGEDFVLAEMVLDILENSGPYVQSSAEAFQVCNHKFYTIKVAGSIGVPVPNSFVAVTPDVSTKIVNRTGFPVVVKLISGFGGKGVMLINSEEEFKPILETIRIFDEFISGQEYVNAEGTDYRALVIGENVFGIRRKGAKGEWRSNVSTGGSAEFVELDDDVKNMALSAAELLGADICSVDFLLTDKGPMVVEINFTPGMIQKFFGNQIALKMIDFLIKKAEEKSEMKKEKLRNAGEKTGEK